MKQQSQSDESGFGKGKQKGVKHYRDNTVQGVKTDTATGGIVDGRCPEMIDVDRYPGDQQQVGTPPGWAIADDGYDERDDEM